MRWLTAGVVLGIGLGGFVDGIALHQIAQWHNMGSAVLPPITMDAMSRNMVWDGMFYAGTWLITVVGVFMLWSAAARRAVPTTAAQLTGELMLGWGLFNLVEGIIDHHLLQLHHVRDMPVHVPAYDWIFLLVAGLGFIGAGWALIRAGERRFAAA